MITYSTFEPKYQQQVIDLILNIQQKEFNVPITINDQKDLLIIPDYYQIKKGNFWLALHDDEVVGTIALIDCGEGIGCIRKMFVKAAFRSQYGIAQQLLDTLLTQAQQHNFQALYLGTIERLKAAIRFYERNGFVFLEKSKLPSQFPIMPVDTHFYEKVL